MRVEPDDAEPSDPRGERFHGAHVRAATAAHDNWPLGERAGDRKRLLGERILVDDACFGVRELEERGLDHGLAVLAPGFRHTHEPGAKGASARVAFVLPALESHRGQRPAVGATRPEGRHG
jgi:hypothetical protein